MVTFSPNTVGRVAIRRSTALSSRRKVARPSWGRRFSAMSMSPMILMRDTTPSLMSLGMSVRWWSIPSILIRTAAPSSWGSTWISDAPCRTAAASMSFTSDTTPSYSASSRPVGPSCACSDSPRKLTSRLLVFAYTAWSASSKPARPTGTGEISTPVISLASSMVTMSVGSTMASIRVPRVLKRMGSTRRARQNCSESMPTVAGSLLISQRADRAQVLCQARAAAIWSGVA